MSADEWSLEERRAIASSAAARAVGKLYDAILDLEKATDDLLDVAADAQKEVSDLEDLITAAKHGAERHSATARDARALLVP